MKAFVIYLQSWKKTKEKLYNSVQLVSINLYLREKRQIDCFGCSAWFCCQLGRRSFNHQVKSLRRIMVSGQGFEGRTNGENKAGVKEQWLSTRALQSRHVDWSGRASTRLEKPDEMMRWWDDVYKEQQWRRGYIASNHLQVICIRTMTSLCARRHHILSRWHCLRW